MKRRKKLVRKNFHEYLLSQQDPNDIYTLYGQQKKTMHDRLENQAVANHLKPLTEKALKEAIQEIINIK